MLQITINSSQEIGKVVFLNSLESDAHYVAHKLADGVVETADPIAQFRHLVDSVPELGKITLL